MKKCSQSGLSGETVLRHIRETFGHSSAYWYQWRLAMPDWGPRVLNAGAGPFPRAPESQNCPHPLKGR